MDINDVKKLLPGAQQNQPKQKQEVQQAEADLVPVYISSAGIETTTKPVMLGEKKKPRKFVQVQINGGEKVDVQCDCRTMVKPEVAEALKGIIEKQQSQE